MTEMTRSISPGIVFKVDIKRRGAVAGKNDRLVPELGSRLHL